MPSASADFTGVDLLLQYDAALCYVCGWVPAQVLLWLARFGRVEILDPAPRIDIVLGVVHPGLRTGPPRYAFCPPSGLNTIFWFDADPQLCVTFDGRWEQEPVLWE